MEISYIIPLSALFLGTRSHKMKYLSAISSHKKKARETQKRQEVPLHGQTGGLGILQFNTPRNFSKPKVAD